MLPTGDPSPSLREFILSWLLVSKQGLPVQEDASESTQLSEGDLALGERELRSQAAQAPVSPDEFRHLLVETSVMLHVPTWIVDLDSSSGLYCMCKVFCT